MRNFILINGLAAVLMLASNLALAAGEDAGDKASASAAKETPVSDEMKKNMGYFFGYSFGNMLKQGGNTDVDLDALQKGMQDSLGNKAPEMTRDQQQAVIAELQQRRQVQQEAAKKAHAAAEAQQNALAEKNEAAAKAFLAENAKKEGVKTTASGLQYKILQPGTGEKPTEKSTVKVNYEGRLTDGTVFDSSKDNGPVQFGLNQVIPGWTEGLQLVKAGGKIRLWVPPELGYGAGGTRGIPPNSVLVFDVDLLEVK